MATPKSRLRTPNGFVTARVEFRQDAAQDFCPGKGQTVVELAFESAEALIECMRELEDQIENVTASINGEILDLKNISGNAKP